MTAASWCILPARLFAVSATVSSHEPAPGDASDTTVPISPASNEETTAPLWMEIYSEGGNGPDEANNVNGYTEIKIGKRISTFIPIDLYGKLRAEADRAHYFWHNHEDVGLGARFPIISKGASLFLMVEGSAGRYSMGSQLKNTINAHLDHLNEIQGQLDRVWNRYDNVYIQSEYIKNGIVNSDQLQAQVNALRNSLYSMQATLDTLTQQRDSLRQITDSLMKIPSGDLAEFRAGLVFWKGWGYSDSPTRQLSFPLRSWGDFYGESIFLLSRRSIHQRDTMTNEYNPAQDTYSNLICSLSPKIGMVAAEFLGGSYIAYIGGNLIVDTRSDWYNNVSSFETGIRFKPFSQIDFAINAGFVAGSYLGRQRQEDENPNKRTFSDFRVQASFWYGMGE